MFPIIDIFAGPGGINEGFSQYKDAAGKFKFETAGSFEMEDSAVQTLTLRAIFHSLQREGQLNPGSAYYSFIRGEISWEDLIKSSEIAKHYDKALQKVHQVELGEPTRSTYSDLISKALGSAEQTWALVGGPPCQAYSLVGRARRTNDESFEQDEKHFLYREYLHILQRFHPPVFVMENVKGMLSATNSGQKMFELITNDLINPLGDNSTEYELYSFTTNKKPSELRPSDFIIRAEDYGIPQRRHRVIILGVRKDLVAKYHINMSKVERLAPTTELATVKETLDDFPKIRSGISREADTWESWAQIRKTAKATQKIDFDTEEELSRGSIFIQKELPEAKTILEEWLFDSSLGGYIQHESRSHMRSDLERYFYISDYARKAKKSPRIKDLPEHLLPNHKNIEQQKETPFNDRFKVQLADSPSTTVVSHIAKDGHYYIHYDPDQMRSLTVREAARLQTFPDNYFFMGNRTQQYTQVGNAVPPLLANKLAGIVASILEKISG